jgi:calcineurin-like phosphoesterase family protein
VLSVFHSKFDGSKTHFIADLHINHKNLCRGVSTWEGKRGTRDFDDLGQMNTAIINSINNQVGEYDTLFSIGDFLFGKKDEIPFWRNAINCRNIHHIYGNHDQWLREKTQYHYLFSSLSDYLEIFCTDRTGKKRFVSLFHYPMKSWNESSSDGIAITGHVHGSLPYEDHELGVDIGWENFQRPLSFHEICDIIDKKTWKAVDHHGRS